MSEHTDSRNDSAEFDNAAEALAELTGRPESEFDASDYEIPDFDEQEIETHD